MASGKIFAAIAAASLLTGCAGNVKECPATVRTVEKKVPVPVKREPPAELMQPVETKPLPVFLLPNDPSATSALTPDGEKALRLLLERMGSRVQAWESWAGEPAEKPAEGK